MTQGLVTVMVGYEVFCKIVAGCDGYNAENLARAILEKNLTEPIEFFAEAKAQNFGSPNNLVVFTEHLFLHETGDEIDDRYRETFKCPFFNPRWEYGTCEHTIIVDIRHQQIRRFEEITLD